MLMWGALQKLESVCNELAHHIGLAYALTTLTPLSAVSANPDTDLASELSLCGKLAVGNVATYCWGSLSLLVGLRALQEGLRLFFVQ